MSALKDKGKFPTVRRHVKILWCLCKFTLSVIFKNLRRHGYHERRLFKIYSSLHVWQEMSWYLNVNDITMDNSVRLFISCSNTANKSWQDTWFSMVKEFVGSSTIWNQIFCLTKHLNTWQQILAKKFSSEVTKSSTFKNARTYWWKWKHSELMFCFIAL